MSQNWNEAFELLYKWQLPPVECDLKAFRVILYKNLGQIILYVFVVLFLWLNICKIGLGTDKALLGQVLITFIASKDPCLSLSDDDSF